MNFGDKWILRLCSNGTYYLHKEGELVLLDNGEYVTFDKFNRESAEELISIMNKQSVALSSLMRDRPFLTEKVISNLKKENEELKSLNEVPSLIVLDTHISQEDFDKIEAMIVKQFDYHSEMHSINRIHALQRENERLKQGNQFNKVIVERAINKKIEDVITSTEYGDVSRGIRLFAQNALIELKQELGIIEKGMM